MKAIVVQENKTVKVEERPTPSLKQNQILLKTRTVGINPTGTLEFIFTMNIPMSEYSHIYFAHHRLEGQSHRYLEGGGRQAF